MQVQHHKFGWVALDKVIAEIIKAINANEPVEGDGVRMVEASRGKIISVAQTVQGSSEDTTAQGSGSTGGPTEGSWMTVTIVDPDTCAQSQIQVWSRPVP